MTPLEVSNWMLATAMPFVLAVMGVSAYGALRLDRFVRRKGCQSPFRAALMLLGYFSTVALAFYFGFGSEGLYSPASRPDYFRRELFWNHIWSLTSGYSLGTVIGMSVLTLTVLAVPKGKRQAGVRRVRFRWQVLAYLCLLLIPAPFLAAAIVAKFSWSTAFKVAVLMVAGYVGASDLAKRMRSRGLEQALKEDSRASVLYLRAFEGEDAAFVSVTFDEAREFGIPMALITSRYHNATLERYLAPAVQRHIGPFVALGDPEDYLPPAGADRQYFADEGWFEAYKELTRNAKAIVMRPQQSNNLMRELEWLRDTAQLSKVVVLTAPSLPGWRGFNWWWTRREQRAWTEFAASLASLGIRLGDYPGDGAVVTFSAQREPVRLAAGVRRPDDYVRSISLAVGNGVGIMAAGS